MSDLEIKVRALGYHLEEGELSSASAAREVIAHFQSELVKANERIAIYRQGITKAIEAIEREDDSSAYDAISYLESSLQLRKEQGGE